VQTRTILGPALAAATVSALPSTSIAIALGDDPLAATVAAGSVLLPRETRRARLVAAAVPVHLALSIGWTVVLARTLPRRRSVAAGAVGGLAIAALDLGLVARLFPRVRALPVAPQLADHALYGATVGLVLTRRR
jgi:hypothetical protein